MDFAEIFLKVIVFITIVGVLYIIGDYLYGRFYVSSEGFAVRSQNFVTNNRFDNANRLSYGTKRKPGMYQEKSPSISGPSTINGVNKNSNVDVYDNRGFKWNVNGSNPQVDAYLNNASNAEVRNKFERTYMLNPDGSVAKYDITNNKMSPNCCPAQFSVPFKLSKDGSNCEYAQKYVANQYSGSNFDSDAGCVCMTPDQANFYGNRGGNGGEVH